jgi:hypothetical protein
LRRTSISKKNHSPTIKKNKNIFSKLLKTTKNNIEKSFSMSLDKESKKNSEN